LLHYVKSAYAVTDVPDQVPELISQRRRWLNGSFFAAIHSIFHFHYLYRSSHSFIRKAWIHVELVYQVFNLIFAWFSLGNYYITFIILADAMQDPAFKIPDIKYVNAVLQYFYLGLLVMCFLLSLGNRPQGSKWGYTTALIGFACITVYMTACFSFSRSLLRDLILLYSLPRSSSLSALSRTSRRPQGLSQRARSSVIRSSGTWSYRSRRRSACTSSRRLSS
jgi:cellulose synthase/poly-beta-1,6-N-acetylglucosamine synthase-like glycosyltransferase